MKNPHPLFPTTRREFLKWSGRGIGLIAFSQFAPSFLVESTLAATPAPEKDRSILVLVQLAGGNDGLNTVIPFEDPEYYRLRPTIGIKKEDTLQINDMLGLHPSLTGLHALMHEGQAAVIQNVGYPNPNHSHFRSSEIWETGSNSTEFLPTGWIGRFLDNDCGGTAEATGTGGDPVAVHVTNELPQSFQAAKPHSTFGLRNGGNRRDNRESLAFLEKLVKQDDHEANANASFLRATMMDALVTEQRVQKTISGYHPESVYPANNFAQSLRNVAALIASGMSTRVYFVSLGGFDTHSNQVNNHGNLLKTLSDGLAAFQKDLVAKKLDSQVLTMTFSEFGRRPNENESRGTDHGTAAPLFIMGSSLKGSLYGSAPSLNLPKNQDLQFTTDFRQVYATVLDKWFSCPTDHVLGKSYDPLGFIA